MLKRLFFVSFSIATSNFCDIHAEDFTDPVRREVEAAPATARDAVTRALRAAGDQAGNRAAAVTRSAILGLGQRATARQISGIVFAAVHAVPDSVLEIVRAAVLVSPESAASEIVAAAASAVPNPWKQVRYQRPAVQEKKGERDFKDGSDGKGGAKVDGGGPGDPADPGVLMTLAEAITQAAFDARSGLSLSSLVSAVDGALLLDPAALMRNVDSPRGISGVGDAGNNNYANEPFRRVIAPVTPVEQPVSR